MASTATGSPLVPILLALASGFVAWRANRRRLSREASGQGVVLASIVMVVAAFVAAVALLAIVGAFLP